MSDPIQGQPQQTGNGVENPPPAQVPTVAPSAATPAPGTPPPAPPVSPEDYQRVQQELETARQSAQHWQSQADRNRAALANVVGAQPPAAAPQDPLAPFVKELSSRGYDPKQSRDLAEVMSAMVTPLQQQIAQQNQYVRQSSNIDSSLQAAYSVLPELFSDPNTASVTRQQLQQWVQQGGLVDESFAIQIASGVNAARQAEARRNSISRPPITPQPQIFQNGMFAIQPQFQAPPVANPALAPLSPNAQMIYDEARAHLKIGGAK